MVGKVTEKLGPMFVKELNPIRDTKVIQLLVLRQCHDYAIFRTEETRELNLVTLPTSVNNHETTTRVAMLASKQKAVENRWYEQLLRTAAHDAGIKLKDNQEKCTLKDNLCQECPRCTLFGSVSTEGGRGERYNFKHRIEYSTAYSIEDYEDISELITFNAVDSNTQSTGQALGFSENVRPLANFPSIVSLISVTQEELIAYIKTLLSCKSYGAESRIKGDMVNLLLGVAAGYEEIITPLEFNLEICASLDSFKKDPLDFTSKTLAKYKEHAMFKDKVVVLSKEEVKSLVDEIANTQFDKKFIETIYKQSETLKQKLPTISSGSESKSKKEKKATAAPAQPA